MSVYQAWAIRQVYFYFRAHPRIFFTEDHIAAQVGVGRRHCRRIVESLLELGKIEAVNTMSSLAWGRPKRMFRSVRTTQDALEQLEVFRTAMRESNLEELHP